MDRNINNILNIKNTITRPGIQASSKLLHLQPSLCIMPKVNMLRPWPHRCTGPPSLPVLGGDETLRSQSRTCHRCNVSHQSHIIGSLIDQRALRNKASMNDNGVEVRERDSIWKLLQIVDVLPVYKDNFCAK